jgi:hypothetical protein
MRAKYSAFFALLRYHPARHLHINDVTASHRPPPCDLAMLALTQSLLGRWSRMDPLGLTGKLCNRWCASCFCGHMAALWSPSGMWSLAPACRGPQPASMLTQVYSGRRKPPRHAVPRRMLAAVAGLVLALMVLASTTPQHAEAYGVGNRTLDKNGRLTHLRFLHIPKTGTSFIMVLRNYLAGECRLWLAAGSGLLAVPCSVIFRKENCRDMECLRHVNVLPRPPPLLRTHTLHHQGV